MDSSGFMFFFLFRLNTVLVVFFCCNEIPSFNFVLCPEFLGYMGGHINWINKINR